MTTSSDSDPRDRECLSSSSGMEDANSFTERKGLPEQYSSSALTADAQSQDVSNLNVPTGCSSANSPIDAVPNEGESGNSKLVAPGTPKDNSDTRKDPHGEEVAVDSAEEKAEDSSSCSWKPGDVVW